MKRLQKVIADSGFASRRRAEELIRDGMVKVNGVVVTEMGIKVSNYDKIEVNGKEIRNEKKEYYLLNKPRNVISSTKDDRNRKTVVDLISTSARIYPIGRLDYDTTGVILLTNDGEFANIIMHPSNKIDKVYVAKLKGIIKKEQLVKLKEGIKLDGVTVYAFQVKLKKINKETNTCVVQMTIHDGKNHQVKRMFEAVGYEVMKLTRQRIGIFELGGLKSGEYRKLTNDEIQTIYSYKK